MVVSQILQMMALLNGYIWSWLLEVVWVLALLPAQSEKKSMLPYMLLPFCKTLHFVEALRKLLFVRDL
jgi:hypothetical protein